MARSFVTVRGLQPQDVAVVRHNALEIAVKFGDVMLVGPPDTLDAVLERAQRGVGLRQVLADAAAEAGEDLNPGEPF